MPAPTRSAPAAFGRGISQVVANPGLLLAPLAFGAATAAALLAVGASAVLLAGGAIASRVAALRRGPAALADLFEGLQGLLLASPGAVLLALLGVLAALLFLTALAAWIRAGVTGCLADADARAADGAPLAAFRHPSLRPAFFASASRFFGGFFALVNLYGIAGTVLVLLLVVPAVGVLAGALARNTALMVLSGLALAVAVPVGIVAGGALRAVYLVAGRLLVREPLDALGAVARAVELVRESPGRTAALYLLGVAGGMAVGLGFVVPRMVLTFVAGWARASLWVVGAVSGAFLVLQIGASLAYDLAVTGSFLALWPVEDAPAPEPPPEIAPA